MQRVLIISRYLRKTKDGHEFHFKGYFNGFRINSIKVSSGEYEKGEDYVLSLNMIKIDQTVLYGKLIKSRKL